MLSIHRELEDGKYANATMLSRALEVSTKTVYRDLEFMRDRLGLPLEYDEQKFGFHYTEKVAAFPSIQISEGELAALVLAEKALKQYRGTTFEKPLLSAFRKIQQSLPETISVSLADVHKTISFRTTAEPLLNLQLFEKLANATAERQQLEFAYRKPGQAQAETRRVDPYHLANINGEWYLFAFDHLRKDIRTFVPARIRDLRVTGRKFERRRHFSLEDRLKDSFMVHSGEGSYRVVLRFSPVAADYIREKKWHYSQVLKDLPGGGVELALELSSLGEVERWVLSWGGEASVVSPPELAASVRKAAERLARG
jgi:proteasome accessory factor B